MGHRRGSYEVVAEAVGAAGRKERAPQVSQPTGRRPVSEEASNGNGLPDDVQRWNAKRRAALNLRAYHAEHRVKAASCRYVTV